MAAQLPTSAPLVLCAHVYQDSVSRLISLLGVCNEFAGPMFPLDARFICYAALSDGIGHCTLSVCLTDSAGNDLGELAASDAYFNDPLATVEMVHTVQASFPKPDVYFLELFWPTA